MKKFSVKIIMLSLLFSQGLLALENQNSAQRFEIINCFEFVVTHQKQIIFETKDLTAPADAAPSQVYQWRLSDLFVYVLNLEFVSMSEKDKTRELKLLGSPFTLDMEKMLIIHPPESPSEQTKTINISICSEKTKNALLQIPNGFPTGSGAVDET